MAMQSFQLDPVAGGVSQAEFDIHTHSYRKLMRIGVDSDDKWGSPAWVDIIDDADNHASESVDLEAAGITVATEETEVPT